MSDKYIVVKTQKQETCCDFLIGESIFVVEKEEWEELGKHITKNTFVETKIGHGHEIDLFELYHRAQILKADETIISFVSANGIIDALKYIRRGTRISRNTKNLYKIMNKLALFREFEKSCEEENEEEKPTFDSVSIKSGSYYGIEKDETVLAWKLPSGPEDIVNCEKFNKDLMEKALKKPSRTLEIILNAEKFWCNTTLHHVFLRVSIPDEICLWNPDVIITIDHKVGTQKRPPPIYSSRRINFKLFTDEIFHTFTEEKIDEELFQFFDCLEKRRVINYCAVQNGILSGIYMCDFEDDVESWETKEGKPAFPKYEGAIHFSTDVPLDKQEYCVAVSLEAFQEGTKKEHEFMQTVFRGLSGVNDALEWINKKVQKISGRKSNYKNPNKQFNLDEFKIDGWTFCIQWIMANLKKDPRI